MAGLKLDDIAKDTIKTVVNGVIDEFQENAIKRLITISDEQVKKIVEAEVTTYVKALRDYAQITDSWWVRLRNNFVASMIEKSTDAIVTSVKESVKKLATEGIDNLQEQGLKKLLK